MPRLIPWTRSIFSFFPRLPRSLPHQLHRSEGLIPKYPFRVLQFAGIMRRDAAELYSSNPWVRTLSPASNITVVVGSVRITDQSLASYVHRGHMSDTRWQRCSLDWISFIVWFTIAQNEGWSRVGRYGLERYLGLVRVTNNAKQPRKTRVGRGIHHTCR